MTRIHKPKPNQADRLLVIACGMIAREVLAVNQASRVTGVARPGAVLLAESAREAIGDAPGFDWSFAGARRLKGIRDEVKLFRARRSAD